MFRFAILGAGKIAVRFANAVKLIDDCSVCAVGSHSHEKARDFAEKNGIPAAYGSYEELLDTEKPDAVYIASVPSMHYETAMLCIGRGIPVLCEKAMFRSSAEAKAAFTAAKEKGVFLMEALWSKFLPVNKWAKEKLASGAIGKVNFTDCAIGFCAPEDDNNRYFNPALAGGAATDITVYAYEITAFLMGCEPEIRSVTAVPYHTGVDASELVAMRAGDTLSTVRTSFVTNFDDAFTAEGSKGKLVIPHPHWANEAFLYLNGKDGPTVEHFVDKETENGFTYEINEVISCVKAGRTESDIQTPANTIACAELFDRIYEALK